MYVSSAGRGKGVFRELYQHIYQLVAHDPDLKGIRLYVDKRNETAQIVYANLGMNGDHYTVFEWMKE